MTREFRSLSLSLFFPFVSIQMAPHERVIDVRVFALAKCIKGVQTEETTPKGEREEQRKQTDTRSAESSLLVTQPLFDK